MWEEPHVYLLIFGLSSKIYWKQYNKTRHNTSRDIKYLCWCHVYFLEHLAKFRIKNWAHVECMWVWEMQSQWKSGPMSQSMWVNCETMLTKFYSFLVTKVFWVLLPLPVFLSSRNTAHGGQENCGIFSVSIQMEQCETGPNYTRCPPAKIVNVHCALCSHRQCFFECNQTLSDEFQWMVP